MNLPAAQAAVSASPAVIAAPANGALPVALAVCARRKQIKQKAKPILLQTLHDFLHPFLLNAGRKPKKEPDVVETQERMAIAGNMGDSCLYFEPS